MVCWVEGVIPAEDEAMVMIERREGIVKAKEEAKCLLIEGECVRVGAVGAEK